MKTLLKRVTLATLMISTCSVPIMTTVSCGEYDSTNRVKIAMNSAPTMNFISHAVSAGVIAPSVLPLFGPMPGASIKNRYQLLPLKMLDMSGGSTQHPNFTYAAMEPSDDGSTYMLDATGRKIVIQIRDYMKWQNGDKIVADNWVDTIKAMLDLNNASEYQYEIERLGFNNAAEAYKAQIDFFGRNGFVYKDPFNYGDANNGVPLDLAPEGMTDAEAIRTNKFPRSLEVCLKLGVEALDDYRIQFTFNHKESLNFMLNPMSPVFWPINRKFIMSNGGFDKFGTSASHVLASGAYKVDTFDSKYGVEFSKNTAYYNTSKTITPYLDFTFISNPQTLGALYEDGRLLSAPVGIDFLPKYLSDQNLRNQTKRSAGIGTLSLFLNRADDHRLNKLFDDHNFRKALYYGIDRKQLMSALHLDFSNPVGVYTAAGSTSPDGELYLEVLSDKKYSLEVPGSSTWTPEEQKKLTDRNFMISPAETRSWMYYYDNLDRIDTEFDMQIARAFMAQAKKDNPEFFPLTLKYPYNSADPVGKGVSIVMGEYLKKVFGNDVSLDASPLPVLVYKDKIAHGDWDLNIKQVDPSTNRPWDFLGEFVNKDVPEKGTGKSTGYVRNNSGGATYKDFFKDLSAEEEASFRQRYGINEFDYLVTKWFISQEDVTEETGGEFSNDILGEIIKRYNKTNGPDYGTLNSYQRQLLPLIQDFNGGQFSIIKPLFENARAEYKADPTNKQVLAKAAEVTQTFQDAKTRFAESSVPYNISFKTIYPVIDCIIREMVPVVPLVEADNKWSASRAMGGASTNRGHWTNPEYLYDGQNKPFTWLESLEDK